MEVCTAFCWRLLTHSGPDCTLKVFLISCCLSPLLLRDTGRCWHSYFRNIFRCGQTSYLLKGIKTVKCQQCAGLIRQQAADSGRWCWLSVTGAAMEDMAPREAKYHSSASVCEGKALQQHFHTREEQWNVHGFRLQSFEASSASPSAGGAGTADVWSP